MGLEGLFRKLTSLVYENWFLTLLVDHSCSIWCRRFRPCSPNSSTCPAFRYYTNSPDSIAFKKYLLPHLQPPTTTAYESDRDALTAQFDAAEALLKEIKAETTTVKDAVAAQQEQVEKATSDVQTAVQEMRDNEASTRDALRDIRAEVDSVREMLPKVNSLSFYVG
jgi:hypothetical protein